MASSSKFIKLQQNILLEWVYDQDNLKQENYQVLSDLIVGKRGYLSKSGLNVIENTIFPIDPIIKKYAMVDTVKYNYLKTENYNTSYVQFDKLRIHLPTSFSFVDAGYIGLQVRVYTYDYSNKNVVDFASYMYDTSVSKRGDITLNTDFYYDEQVWGKYITFDIPSPYIVSNQRTSSVNSNVPTPNSINANLTQLNGISQNSPIFIEFSYVINKETILGNTYYYMSDIFTKSLSMVPDYQDLVVNINQAIDGDYFEIYGSYGGSNQSMDDFIADISSKGRKVKLEYAISLFEENILMSTQTFTVTENFTKKLWYRPVLSFTNTTASIDVTMKVIDLVDNSSIDRTSSISLTSDVFKYGKSLTRINIDNAWKPKIYNFKNSLSNNVQTQGYTTNVSLTKVNYPVISDRIDILVGSSPSRDSSFKPMGLAEIIISPFGNVVTFHIASSIDNSGSAVPYDLTKITENSNITLSFKSDNEFIEKNLWQESDLNNFEHGIIVFRIEQQDVPLLKKLGSNKFYITVNSEKTGVRSLLYSGKWFDFEKLTFFPSNTTGTDLGISDFNDLTLSEQELKNLLDNNAGVNSTNTSPNSNVFVFLDPEANIKIFDEYLTTLGVNVYLRKPGGNSTCLTYLYFLLNVSQSVIEDIKMQKGVKEVIPIPFCLGADTNGSNTVNLQNIKDRVVGFNCANATKTP